MGCYADGSIIIRFISVLSADASRGENNGFLPGPVTGPFRNNKYNAISARFIYAHTPCCHIRKIDSIAALLRKQRQRLMSLSTQ